MNHRLQCCRHTRSCSRKDVGGFLLGDGNECLRDAGVKLGSTAAEQARNRFRMWKALLRAGPGLGHDWLVVRAIGRTREPTPMLNLRMVGFERFRELVDVGSARVG